jgi:MYXO-CTERM domain-containing protein
MKLSVTNGRGPAGWMMGAALAAAALLCAPHAGATTASGGPDPQLDAGEGGAGIGGAGGSGTDAGGSSSGCAVVPGEAGAATGAAALLTALALVWVARQRRR